MVVVATPTKANPPKDGDAKPRILASFATLPADATRDPKIAELPKGHLLITRTKRLVKTCRAAIVIIVGGILLFLTASVDLRAQEVSVLDKTAPRRWRISFHVGGIVGGPQQDLEDEMSRAGFDDMSPPFFFGGRNRHPFTRHDLSGTASIRYAFRPHYGVELVMASSTTGETHGFQRGQLQFPTGDFLILRHSAISLAPIVSAEFGAFDIGIGPAFHRWKMEQDPGITVAEDTSWKAGFLVDAGLKGPARTRLFGDLRVQYRGAIGKWKVDSFQVGSTDAPVMFPSTELAYGHLFLGAGMGIRF